MLLAVVTSRFDTERSFGVLEQTDVQDNNKFKDKFIMAVQSRVAAVTGANKGIGIAIGMCSCLSPFLILG
jgi:hypothetical protein